MKSRIAIISFLLLCSLTYVTLSANDRKPQPPLTITEHTPETEVFSQGYLVQLGNHDATLRAIDGRLKGMDDKLTGIQTTLDKDVLPTIHVFDFLKWLIALIIAAGVGALVSGWFKNRTVTPAKA
jgi:hypothetical protein